MILYHFGWRWSYIALGLMMFVIGLLTAAIFKPRDTVDQLEDSSNMKKPCDQLLSVNVAIPQRTKVLMKLFWFLATALKTIGYSIPLVTLVIITFMHFSFSNHTQNISIVSRETIVG